MIWLILYIWISILVMGTLGIVLLLGRATIKWNWYDFITFPVFCLLWPVSVPLFFIWVALS